MNPDTLEIRDVHTKWINAVNAGDLESLLAMITDDVVFLNPGQPPFGREGFSANFRRAHKEIQLLCTSELEEVVVVGDVAYTRSRDTLSVTARSSAKAAQLAGYRMTVYRTGSDGRWLLARDVHTLTSVEG